MRYKLYVFIITLSICFASCSTLIDCPQFNPIYLNWVPYQEGDTISFENNKKVKTYIVCSYIATHTKNYPSNTKCCGCNDDIVLSLVNANDSINLKILYQNSKNSTYISTILCNKNSYRIEHPDNQLLIANIQIRSNQMIIPDNIINNIFIKKEIGITKFSNKNETWTLKEHQKNRIPRHVKIKKENYK